MPAEVEQTLPSPSLIVDDGATKEKTMADDAPEGTGEEARPNPDSQHKPPQEVGRS